MAFTLGKSLAAFDAQSATWDEAEAPASIRLTANGPSLNAAVFLDAVTREQRPDGSGFMRVQRARIELRKTLVTAAPAERSVVRVGTDDFQVMEVGGQNPHSATWSLQCMRILPSA
jgi:hypothetical protein